MLKFCVGDIKRKNSSYQDFINKIQQCPIHHRRCEFICLQRKCQQNLILCPECIVEHNGHKFETLQKYFCDEDRYEKLVKGGSQKHKHFDDLANLVKKKLGQIQAQFLKQIQGLRTGIQDSMYRLKALGKRVTMQGQTINQKAMLTIKKYLESQWTYVRCQKMKQCFDKILNAVQDSYRNTSQDLLTFIEEQDWEQIEQIEYLAIQDKYFKHLHNHKQKVVDYYKFDPDQKSLNIKIKGKTQADYIRDTPAYPFVVCDNFIIPQKNKWIFYVKQCDATMLFFNASIIYVGVCKPDTAKRMNYVRMNQSGRGAYLIGSNGWSYHHTNPQLDRQDIVGFTFGKGDRILIQIQFKNRGKIKFKKMGKFYHNKFQMSLDMEQRHYKNLKPCIGFHDQIGVQVVIQNPA